MYKLLASVKLILSHLLSTRGDKLTELEKLVEIKIVS